LMPSRVYEYHQQPDVIGIPLEEYIECNLVLVREKNRKLPGNVSIFIDFMKRYSDAAGM